MKTYDLREACREKGPKVIARWLIEATQRKDDPVHLTEASEFDPSGVSIKELHFIFTGREVPAEGLFLGLANFENLFEQEAGLREDVSSTAFVVVTGNLIQRQFIAAYEEVPRIGPSLASNYPSKLKIDNITGFKTMDLPDLAIAEGANYPEFGVTDKYVTYPEPKKWGGIVPITKETIHYDQTGQIVKQAAELGTRLATFQEWLDIGQVFDAFFGGTDYFTGAYFPSGTVAELYPTGDGNNNYASGASTALTLANGPTAIRTARNKFSGITDDSEDAFPIIHQPNTIICADTEADIVDVILNSTGDPSSANLRKNPMKNARHRYAVLTSEIVTWFQDSGNYSRVPANAWLMGNFPKMFERKVIFPLSTFISRGEDSDDAVNKDVVFRFKCRSKMGIFARDTRHVVFVKGAA